MVKTALLMFLELGFPLVILDVQTFKKLNFQLNLFN